MSWAPQGLGWSPVASQCAHPTPQVRVRATWLALGGVRASLPGTASWGSPHLKPQGPPGLASDEAALLPLPCPHWKHSSPGVSMWLAPTLAGSLVRQVLGSSEQPALAALSDTPFTLSSALL